MPEWADNFQKSQFFIFLDILFFAKNFTAKQICWNNLHRIIIEEECHYNFHVIIEQNYRSKRLILKPTIWQTTKYQWCFSIVLLDEQLKKYDYTNADNFEDYRCPENQMRKKFTHTRPWQSHTLYFWVSPVSRWKHTCLSIDLHALRLHEH